MDKICLCIGECSCGSQKALIPWWKRIDLTYPLLWGIDTKSIYKSIWLGWVLITWRFDEVNKSVVDFSVDFQPGL